MFKKPLFKTIFQKLFNKLLVILQKKPTIDTPVTIKPITNTDSSIVTDDTLKKADSDTSKKPTDADTHSNR